MIKNIFLSNLSNIPIYQQLYDQIVIQIFNEDLTSNMPLPSIRTAAKELRISRMTLDRLFKEYEEKTHEA